MYAHTLQTLASHWLCHSDKEGQRGCQSDEDYVWCRLLDRSQACCQQTQLAHSACTTTTRQESAKKIGCLQAEKRQQEANIGQWYLQPLFRCTGTQFRNCTWRCRWELDSLQRHRSLSSNELLGPVSRIHQGWFDENENEIQGLLEEKHRKHKACLSDTSSVFSKCLFKHM